MPRFIDGLNDGLKAEVAFAVEQFSKLPKTERRRILKLIGSTSKSKRSEGALRVGKLLCDADTDALTTFINNRIAGGQKLFDAYLPCMNSADRNKKMIMVGLYFHENLPKSGIEIPQVA